MYLHDKYNQCKPQFCCDSTLHSLFSVLRRVAQDRLCSLTVKTQHPVTNMYKSVLYHQNLKEGDKEKASGIWLRRVDKPRCSTQTTQNGQQKCNWLHLLGCILNHWKNRHKGRNIKKYIKKKIWKSTYISAVLCLNIWIYVKECCLKCNPLVSLWHLSGKTSPSLIIVCCITH